MGMIPYNELKIGMVVEARFTNSGRNISFKGEIVKINVCTARVKSLKDGVQCWERGHEFIIFTELNPLASVNNGMFKEVV